MQVLKLDLFKKQSEAKFSLKHIFFRVKKSMVYFCNAISHLIILSIDGNLEHSQKNYLMDN